MKNNSVRKWHMSEALHSFPRLAAVINELTEQEVMACLDLEAATQRRRSFIDRLISRAVRLHEIKVSLFLKEKYHVPSFVQNHVDPSANQRRKGLDQVSTG